MVQVQPYQPLVVSEEVDSRELFSPIRYLRVHRGGFSETTTNDLLSPIGHPDARPDLGLRNTVTQYWICLLYTSRCV